MKYGEHKLRHELKYFVNYHEYQYLHNRLLNALELDKYAALTGSYHIRSLYFDDIYQTALEEKEAGVLLRRKFRIRIYNISDRVIKLEKKSKFGQYISKTSKSITKDQFYRLLDNDCGFLLESGDKLFREFYIEIKNNLMRPVVIVDYDREAFVFEAGNVRITFDQGLRAGINSFDIFDSTVVTKGIFNSPMMIMEVKYDSFLPAHIHDLIQITNHNLTAASKYVMCHHVKSGIRYLPIGG
ncbi:MAG: polyphosphate polymerase domain-containing protein [Thermincola sp.]|jgi:hypothetical protein|nr:polyphosphate polymerase domain-containing protein [Thermincola sp.]MDT3704103.1 polyphosphate polymerase domain-containing protein [Thermincola sp.]